MVSGQQELDPWIVTTLSLFAITLVFHVLDDDLFLLWLQFGLYPLHDVEVGERRVRSAEVARL